MKYTELEAMDINSVRDAIRIFGREESDHCISLVLRPKRGYVKKYQGFL